MTKRPKGPEKTLRTYLPTFSKAKKTYYFTPSACVYITD